MLTNAPGVYTPQEDTRFLIEALRAAAVPAGAKVLDVGTGTGALALAALRAGAATVTAVDVSLRAVLTARLNTLGRPVRVRWGNVLDVRGRFDLVLANPPYVPANQAARGQARAWDAGVDGRELLDPLCAKVSDLLEPGGTLLLVHSGLCGVDTTVSKLRDAGLKASVVDRRWTPFGPVMRGRIPFLEARKLVEPGQRHEELVVIRGDKPA
ncbi:HemK2/MTQ2 family protein methyltransferase [Lentzea sp. BCCO 10_0856]|uniref:HemK2/MTQ2 family protein methyltransferase n=2 Tax=Lentzea miocenica TaxID=3095431 RepID=A0ABU4T7S4_9PSEU|nr:HemK2/MTQ2 family protein methyltransferase [Lentzea sp. BCCO 10_0856]MDX8034218.1 HemK2/MTQ2 family protein methyltransferase [Lentzea sp. BCCO 10_0856]